MSTVNEKLTALADAIRAKTGSTEPLTLDGMTTAVENISSGGSSGGTSGVETYDLIIQSDGVVELSGIDYISYINGQYQLHTDATWNMPYPLTFNNVVLKTPIRLFPSGGFTPYAELISNIEYATPYDYVAGSNLGYGATHILPLSSDNGQIIIRVFDDD